MVTTKLVPLSLTTYATIFNMLNVECRLQPGPPDLMIRRNVGRSVVVPIPPQPQADISDEPRSDLLEIDSHHAELRQ